MFALNREPLGFDAAAVDALLLALAHLDHSGRLPVLLKQGFRGPIHARPATIELAEHLLLDAAKIQHEDAERDRRHGRTPDPPLFDEDDVYEVLARMQPFEYGEPFDAAGLAVTAQQAGHIPGSAVFSVRAGETTVAFSGDVGNARKEVLPDPAPCPDADLVLMEGTYGDRDHKPYDATIEELAGLLRRAEDRGGRILIPSFALERTHEVLYTLAHLERDHDIAPLPVYVDSPLASKVDEVYARHPEELSDELRLQRSLGKDPFRPKHLRYTRTVDDSRKLTGSDEPAIVIAGSGMLSGGRILHHLLAGLGDPSTTVLIVGFQPRGGLGRELIEGAERVRIMGHDVAVRAQVATVGGLSAHADRGELLDWIRPAGAHAQVRLVHGEPHSLGSLRDALAAEGIAASLQPSEVALPDGHGQREEAGE
jgi:metallo-beta-lactamase family protein